MLERCLIGLYAGAAASLGFVIGLSALLGRRIELLPQNHGLGPWLWLVLWALLALLLALPRRPLAGWRLGLALSALALVVVGGSGLVRGSPLALELAVACAVLATGTAALGLSIGPGRVRAVRTSARVTSEGSAAVDAARPASPARRSLTWLAWVMCGAVFVQGFAAARSSGGDAVIGAGHAGMLVSFFLMLPGAALVRWFPRAATGLWLASAGAFALLFLRSQRLELVLVALGVGVCSLALRVRGGDARPQEVGA